MLSTDHVLFCERAVAPVPVEHSVHKGTRYVDVKMPRDLHQRPAHTG